MTDRPDKDTIDDVTWQEAVLREAVIRRLVCDGNPNRTDFHRACQELGIKRSRQGNRVIFLRSNHLC